MKRPFDANTSTEISDLHGVAEHSGHEPELGNVAARHFELEQEDDRAIEQIRLLWDHRGILGRVTGVGLLLTVVVALLIPNRYQSVARLMPPDNQSSSSLAMAAAALTGSTTGSGGFGGIASQLLGLKSTSDLLVGILASRTVADNIIHQFNLQKVYGDRRMTDAQRDLESRTDTAIDRKSQIITITVTDHDPHRAEGIANAYVENLNRLVAQVSTSSARRERIFLEGRLKSVNQDLEQAEKDFSKFASNNSAIDIKEQSKAMVDAAATLQGRLIAARSELEGLRQFYTDNNVRVRSMEARVTELEDELKKVGGENPDGSALSASAEANSLYPSIRQLPILGVPYADLYRRTKVEETVFATLTQEYEMAKVEEAKEIPTVKVLDSPSFPDKKSFPPRTLIVLLGTLLSFALATTWVLGSAKWNATDSANPRKALAREILVTTKAAMPWSRRNGFKD